MSVISEDYLLFLNKQGLIPAPEENERDFLLRAKTCLSLSNSIKEIAPTLPIDTSQQARGKKLKNAAKKTKALFDFEALWPPIFYSNRRLSFWQGACTWILDFKKGTSDCLTIQLRKKLKENSSYLKIYSHDELLSHEMAHAGRMQFNETRYEEIFAYMTSKNPFRRFFGPFMQNPIEASLFSISILSTFAALIFSLLVFPSFLEMSLFLQVLPLSLFTLGIARLVIRKKRLRKCLGKLKKLLINKEEALFVAFRLSDQEIENFSRNSLKDIRGYIEYNATRSNRWLCISSAYPFNFSD